MPKIIEEFDVKLDCVYTYVYMGVHTDTHTHIYKPEIMDHNNHL